MGITVQDVRDSLNGMTEGELSSDAITFWIKKGEKKATSYSDVDDYVLAYAAFHGFIRSKVWEKVKMADISTSKSLRTIHDDLKKEMEDEEIKLFGSTEPVSSLMYDNRPTDPYETGDIDYGDYE